MSGPVFAPSGTATFSDVEETTVSGSSTVTPFPNSTELAVLSSWPVIVTVLPIVADAGVKPETTGGGPVRAPASDTSP